MNSTELSIDNQASSSRNARPLGHQDCCIAYGLTISSELPLPEFTRLPRQEVDPDVIVRFGSGREWIPFVRHQESSWHVDEHDARFWFSGVGGFRVSHGREIVLSPEPGIDPALLRLYVEGMMMAAVLYQRNFFVLHASVVRIGASAAAFIGHAGAGKSSAAAALHVRGHAVVTDDNAAIDLAAPSPHVTPAFPYLKVFPAVAASLGYGKDSLQMMHASQPKHVKRVARGFPSAPVRLSSVYVLAREADTSILPLNPAETVMELLRNSVPARWKLNGGFHHLRQCVRLAGRIPAWRVKAFNGLDDLPRLADLIESHHGAREASDTRDARDAGDAVDA